MIFENKETQQIEDLTAHALPSPNWWGFLIKGLLTALAVALITWALSACGDNERVTIGSDGKVLPFADPTTNVVGGVESSPQLLSGSAANFGSSSYGMNYTCGENLCSCHDRGHDNDCFKMITEGRCAGLPHCDAGPGPLWCICRAVPPSGGSGCPSCPIADVEKAKVTQAGFYTIPGNATVWEELTDGDRACAVLGSQWGHLTASMHPPSLVNLTDPGRQIFLTQSMSGQYCTDAEAGDWNPDRASVAGLYRTSDGTIRLLGSATGLGPALRACGLSWHQYHDLLPNQPNGADPAFTDLPAGLDSTGFFLTSYTGNVAPCLDMEVLAH